MPFCPKCHYEYRDDVFKCPDCDEYLVPQVPDEAETNYGEEPDYSQWVKIARMTSVDYVSLLTEIFNSKNIPAVAKSGAGHFGQIGAMGSASFVGIGGAVSIYVPEEYVVEADIEADIVLGDVWRKSRLIESDIKYETELDESGDIEDEIEDDSELNEKE